MSKISQAEINRNIKKIIENSLIETFVYYIIPELKIKINNIANEILSAYSPVKYKRRNNGLGHINNIEIVYFVENDIFQYTWNDTTKPNISLKKEEWIGNDVYGNEYNLADLISGITYDENGNIESELGLIPNIFNENTDYEWAEPNYRPYIQKVNEYLESKEFVNYFINKLTPIYSQKIKVFLKRIKNEKRN